MSLIDTYGACDGMVIASPEAYEPAAITAIREWFAGTGNRSVWAIGPLFPPTASKEAMAGEATLSESFGDIKKFMDNTLALHGEHSMLYVSPHPYLIP